MEEEVVDITEVILNAINTIFSNLFSSIDNSVYSLLDDLTFISEDFLQNSFLENILGSATQNGIILIANSILIGFILYYSISSFLAYFTFSANQKPVSFIFKLIFYTVLMNFSFFFCEQIISLNSLLSLAIRNVGETLFSKSICFSSLIDNLNSVISVGGEDFNLFSIDGLIKGFISFGLFNLVFTYSLRYIMLKVFVLISPFAIVTLILDKTSWFFKAWLRSFFTLLMVQNFIAIVLLVAFSVDFNDNLLSKLLYVGCIYALMKANSYVREIFGGISTDVSTGFAGLKSRFTGGRYFWNLFFHVIIPFTVNF